LTLDEMVVEARSLPAVPSQAAAEYGARTGWLLAAVNHALRARADLPRLLGGNRVEVMESFHAFHAGLVSAAFALEEIELLAKTLPWLYRARLGQGFSPDYFPVELEAWTRAVEQQLPAGRSEPVLALYRWMAARDRELLRLALEPRPEERVAADDGWAGIRERYLRALLDADPAAAREASNCVAAPGDLPDFYLSVIQPAMYRVGSLWESGAISVAQEHLASAITNRVVLGLAATLRTIGRPWRGLAVVSAAPGELHELGAWMVSDLLELDGWAVRYLGANTPPEDLISLVATLRPDLLGLSATMVFNLPKTKEIIGVLRTEPSLSAVRILVGGAAFALQPGLWKRLGAHAWAADARDASRLARSLGPSREEAHP
jgi:methanogenic corrinoid protein MtbC1